VSETVLDRMVACIGAALAYDPQVQERPVALLWPDEGGQWLEVIERIGERLPVVSLGDFDPASRRGPAYWLRCVLAGTIDVGLPEGTPIVYLPGASRNAMRAADGCPAELAPIAELQYRGQWFSHPNNRDWTPWALLSHGERGLGLRLADDAETKAALPLALERLLDERIDRVAKQVLDADYLLELVNQDPVRSVLEWLDDPRDYRARSDDAGWRAFARQCEADYDFEPAVGGEVGAARALGLREGAWGKVWKRFSEVPDRYPGVVEQLRRARPEELVLERRDAWPQENEGDEEQLRDRLRGLAPLTPEGARDRIAQLDEEHGWRRGTVWADLDQAPLAFALEQLAVLAELTERPLASADLDSLRADYAERGWRADDAVLRALAAAPAAADREAVSVAVAATYRHWLDAAAKALQGAIGPLANAGGYEPAAAVPAIPGTVCVFVDGLRLDVSHRVRERLTDAGLEAAVGTDLAALPTVTQTAKPAVAPIARGALGSGPDLQPASSATGTKASNQVLRGLMADNGVQILEPADAGDPSGVAWTEVGEIDHRGHDAGVRLADFLDEEVSRIAARVRELLEAGWVRVDVLTDHGWVLLPGGMEKVELPPAMTEVKKGRCARLKDGAVVETPTVPWFWDRDVRIALAPGAACFEANKEYEHGGVSPQECIVPRLTVTAGPEATSGGPELDEVKWLGLQCRVEFSGVTDKVTIDLRGDPAEPDSSIAERAKEASSSGKVSLLVPDEQRTGERAHLVLAAPNGRILAQREVMVGKNR
jgi:hypothetical protein